MIEARTAKHWRSKAQEARRTADERRGDSKDAFLEVARAYDRLAEVTEKSGDRVSLRSPLFLGSPSQASRPS